MSLMSDWRSDDKEGGGSPALVVRRRGPNRIAVIAALVLLAIIVLVAGGVWIARRPIAEGFIERELEKRGVRATYDLDRVGLHNQVISNIVIGDPARPDLVARQARVQMRIKWNGGVEVYRIVARGVRLKGRLLDSGRVSWGEIDKLLPPPSGKPFRLPDIAVDVADTAIALDTKFGRLGFAVMGAGNLTGGFKGRLAAASRGLDVGACQLSELHGNVAIAVEARRPEVRGPISAAQLSCPRSRMGMVRPRLDLDSEFSEAFESFDGKGRLAVASLTAGDNGLANLIANVSFKGTATDARGSIDLAAQRARLAAILADRTRIRGNYRLWAGRGELAVVADYAASNAALAGPMLGQLTAPFAAADETPLGPIARAIGAAIRRTASGFDATGSLRLVNFPGGGGVRVGTANVAGPNGARIRVSGGDGVTYYWPSSKIRIDGNISMGGGGLPRAEVRLNQPRDGGPMSGEARVAPYAAGGARVALAPITFRAARDGSTNVTTVALLDGPLSGGHVRGLRIPIEGRIGGPAGGFAFGRGCIEARFVSLQLGALRLGPTRLPICPEGPAILYQTERGSVAVRAFVNRLRLAGRMGQSPFLLTSARARMTGSQNFQLTDSNLTLGRPEAPVRVKAANLTGGFKGSGISGAFSGGAATIGRVPIRLSEASGNWLFYKGALDIDGSATVSDMADPPKFYPLRTDNLDFRLANDMIRTTGSLRHPASGTLVTNVNIEHRLSTGVGEAILDVPGIRFGSNLQPDELTRLTEGVIALVNGTITGQGRIAWSGSGNVTSTGEFSTTGTDLAASFGPVTGLSGTIRFTDLLGLETAPGQIANVASINPGILVENGQIRYQILPGQMVRIERGEWPFMGGRLILQETILNFSRPTPKRLTFEVVALDAKTFVDTLGFNEFQATGTFDGVLPMIFDDAGGRIVGGRLDSRPPGGTLAYNGVVNRANLGMFAEIAFDALRSLRYQSMIIRLDGDLAGEFATRLTIDQVSLGDTTKTQRFIRAINRIPFKFNINITGPFRALIATAKSYRDPRTVIDEVIPGPPLQDVPGIVTEVRRREEQQQQTQTPVDQQVDVTPQPPAPSE